MSARTLLTEWLAELRTALRENTPLRLALWWQLVLLAIGLVALPFDSRRILGINPWIKPLKFELSVILYLLTLALFLYALARDTSRLSAWKRSRFWLGIGFAVCMTVENTVIALQSARGVRSHMNYTSLADGVLFGIMGVFIFINTALVFWLFVVWCVAHPRVKAATKWGIGFGLAMLLLGSVEGVMIVQHGAHTVGAKDGLDGLPFLNWSRGYGDLRVAHFFAIHALQIFPLAGVLFSMTRWRRSLQIVAVCLFVGAYTGGVWWLFAEAMRAHPLLAY